MNIYAIYLQELRLSGYSQILPRFAHTFTNYVLKPQNTMKTLFTTLQKVLAVCLFITLAGAGTANAQGIIPPDDPADLQTLPLVFNVDNTDEIDWEGFTMLPFEGAGLVRIENPDKSGINTTDFVIEYKKGGAGEGGQPWAGFFYNTDGEMEINADAVFRLQVWSPRSDIQFLLKLEMSQFPDVNTGDLFVPVTAANEWVQLEWDLSGVEVAPYDRVVIIADLDGGAGDAGDNFTWYIDNFEFENGEATSINDDMEVPSAITLEQNYPNPFNPTTNITFTLSENAPVTLEVYNVLGNRVATLVDGEMRTAGSHTVSFDAMNLSSGIYMYRLSTPSQSLTRTMSLIK